MANPRVAESVGWIVKKVHSKMKGKICVRAAANIARASQKVFHPHVRIFMEPVRAVIFQFDEVFWLIFLN